MNKAPVFFLSHGAPDFALEPGVPGARLRSIGQRLPELEALIVVSAHWQTHDIHVMTTPKPDTIHDFRGFDPALYDIRYPAPGHPEAARSAAKLLRDAGFTVHEDARRGLDHGAWVPLLHLRPDADIPVIQVSLPVDADTRTALRMGQALAPLRRQGMAIVGSGSLTHNLYEALGHTPQAPEHAEAFGQWVRETLTSGNIEALVSYRQHAPAAERNHPTEEHFLPLLVAAGATEADEPVTSIDGEMRYGVLLMDSWAWGLAAEHEQAAPP